MRPVNYLPPNDQEKLDWLNNFAKKLPFYASALGLSIEEIQTIGRDAKQFELFVRQNYPTENKNLGEYKRIVLEQQIADKSRVLTVGSQGAPPTWIFRKLSNTVMKIKTHPGFNSIIGKELGILTETLIQKEPDENVVELKKTKENRKVKR